MRPIRAGTPVVLLVCAALGACGSTGVACTTEFRYGISIRALDAASGQPLAAGLAGTLSDGSYHETMQVFPDGQLVGAGERAGTYAATVSATGYQTWTQQGIRVEADRCHVQGVHVDARLTGQP